MSNDKNEDKLLTSNYDGIQEYDNSLPRWWLYLFYITIVWTPIYVLYYHGGFAESAEVQVEREMKELEAVRSVSAKESAPTTDETQTLLALTKNPEVLKQGKGTFATKCLACHGANGEGLIGPNLTDEYWIHGGSITEIKHIVEVGVLDKGMLAWKSMMSPEELNSVVAFVWSLHGTNPANAKAPQGNKVTR